MNSSARPTRAASRFASTTRPTRPVCRKIFRSVSGDREEEAFVLYTPSDLTHLLYHALDNRGYRSVAMEGIGPDYPGQVVATDAAAAVRIGMDHLGPGSSPYRPAGE